MTEPKIPYGVSDREAYQNEMLNRADIMGGISLVYIQKRRYVMLQSYARRAAEEGIEQYYNAINDKIMEEWFEIDEWIRYCCVNKNPEEY